MLSLLLWLLMPAPPLQALPTHLAAAASFTSPPDQLLPTVLQADAYKPTQVTLRRGREENLSTPLSTCGSLPPCRSPVVLTCSRCPHSCSHASRKGFLCVFWQDPSSTRAPAQGHPPRLKDTLEGHRQPPQHSVSIFHPTAPAGMTHAYL